jgi:hypothetical protein
MSILFANAKKSNSRETGLSHFYGRHDGALIPLFPDVFVELDNYLVHSSNTKCSGHCRKKGYVSSPFGRLFRPISGLSKALPLLLDVKTLEDTIPAVLACPLLYKDSRRFVLLVLVYSVFEVC